MKDRWSDARLKVRLWDGRLASGRVTVWSLVMEYRAKNNKMAQQCTRCRQKEPENAKVWLTNKFAHNLAYLRSTLPA